MAISRCNTAGFRLLLGLALVIVTWLVLTPRPVPMPDQVGADKWAHLLAFTVLAYLADASWPSRGFDALKWVPLGGYAIALESLQMWVPNRFFELWDIAANLLGIALYALVLTRLFRSVGLR